MSLENEISRLTAAIEKLNANIELVLSTPVNQTAQPAEPVSVPPKVEAVEPVQKPETIKPEINANDVTALCLSLSRKDAKNKDAIRALLDDFGAKKVSDLGDNLAAFAAKLEQL